MNPVTGGPSKPVDATPNAPAPWTVRVITLLPEAFPGILNRSVTGRALLQGLWQLEVIDLRAFGQGPHSAVDDRPAGGGPGMVIRPDVLAAAIEAAAEGAAADRAEWPIFCLSPRGRKFDQQMAAAWSCRRGVTLLCARFEGIDQRVLDHFAIPEISIGDFILSGGDIAAHALIDATVRTIPHVLGNRASIEDETFTRGLLEYPHYTRPRVWRGNCIPDVLLSGDHGRISAWRLSESERLTKSRRPDLWQSHQRGRQGD